MPNQKFICDLIQEAGELTLSYFQKNFEVTEKSDNQGIVTSADFASENFIKKQIHNEFPTHGILAEESGMEKYSNSENEYLWIIDPLDGTTNFSKGNSYYCISIAFGKVTNKRFSPILAAVYQPTTKKLFFAEKNKGTFLNGQKIKTSSLNQFKLASFATGFSSNKGESLKECLNSIYNIQNSCLGVRINGAAALDLANTSYGIIQGFYEVPLAPWDTAAGALLVLEAGGKVTNYAGENFCPLNDRDIIACNIELYNEIFSKIKKS
jgi:myo-inositol-1(or 4)-monophosphatase